MRSVYVKLLNSKSCVLFFLVQGLGFGVWVCERCTRGPKFGNVLIHGGYVGIVWSLGLILVEGTVRHFPILSYIGPVHAGIRSLNKMGPSCVRCLPGMS